MSDQIEPGLTEEEVKTYNSALDSFIKLNANYVDFTEKSDGFTYITMRYGLAHDEVLRELALKCKNEIIDNSFVIGQFNWTIVYANSAILRFKCSTNTIATKIENDAKTDEVLFKSTTASYAENFDNDVAAYIKHYITTNATEPSNVNAELGFSFYKYGNKTHLGIDCAALNKYATSHRDDTVIVALNTVCINTIGYYTNSPKTVTELLSNALAERKLSLEKVNSKVIIFGYNPDEDTGELETTEILEAWKQAQQEEPEDPNSGNTDPSDPGTGGNDDPNQNEPSGGDEPDPNDPGTGGNDDPNSGNDPSGSGDDPSQGGDDPSGTQDEFAYEKIPWTITKIIVNYNVLEKNNETGKITFNDTFEPVANDGFSIATTFYTQSAEASGGVMNEWNIPVFYITDECANTYYICSDESDADALLTEITENSRKIVTQQKKILTVPEWQSLFTRKYGTSTAEEIFNIIKTNNDLKQALISNLKIYNGLTSVDNTEITDNELFKYICSRMYLGNEQNIIYLKQPDHQSDEILYPNLISNITLGAGYDIDDDAGQRSENIDEYFNDYQNLDNGCGKSMIDNLAARARRTGTALNLFILDDVNRYFDENFDQNEYDLGNQRRGHVNKVILHYGDIKYTAPDPNKFEVKFLDEEHNGYAPESVTVRDKDDVDHEVELKYLAFINKQDKCVCSCSSKDKWLLPNNPTYEAYKDHYEDNPEAYKKEYFDWCIQFFRTMNCDYKVILTIDPDTDYIRANEDTDWSNQITASYDLQDKIRSAITSEVQKHWGTGDSSDKSSLIGYIMDAFDKYASHDGIDLFNIQEDQSLFIKFITGYYDGRLRYCNSDGTTTCVKVSGNVIRNPNGIIDLDSEDSTDMPEYNSNLEYQKPESWDKERTSIEDSYEYCFTGNVINAAIQSGRAIDIYFEIPADNENGNGLIQSNNVANDPEYTSYGYDKEPRSLRYIVLHYGNPNVKTFNELRNELTHNGDESDFITYMHDKFDIENVGLYSYLNSKYKEDNPTSGPRVLKSYVFAFIDKKDNVVLGACANNRLYDKTIFDENGICFDDKQSFETGSPAQISNLEYNVFRITEYNIVTTDKKILIPYLMSGIDHYPGNNSLAVGARNAIKHLLRLGNPYYLDRESLAEYPRKYQYKDFFDHIIALALSTGFITEEESTNYDDMLHDKLEQFIDERYFRLDGTNAQFARPEKLAIGTSDGFTIPKVSSGHYPSAVSYFSDDVFDVTENIAAYADGGTSGIYMIPYSTKTERNKQICEEATEYNMNKDKNESNEKFNYENISIGNSSQINVGCCIIDAAIQSGRAIDIYLME